MKVLFEIYRDGSGGPYRVVHFTELGADERDAEIERAMNGEHVFDGFAVESDDARRAIEALVDRLNRGERLDGEAIAAALDGVLV